MGGRNSGFFGSLSGFAEAIRDLPPAKVDRGDADAIRREKIGEAQRKRMRKAERNIDALSKFNCLD